MSENHTALRRTGFLIRWGRIDSRSVLPAPSLVVDRFALLPQGLTEPLQLVLLLRQSIAEDVTRFFRFLWETLRLLSLLVRILHACESMPGKPKSEAVAPLADTDLLHPCAPFEPQEVAWPWCLGALWYRGRRSSRGPQWPAIAPAGLAEGKGLWQRRAGRLSSRGQAQMVR